MACCTGCEIGTGCEGGGGACPLPPSPPVMPATVYAPNINGARVATGALPGIVPRPSPARAVYVPRPSPARAAQAAQMMPGGFWAVVRVRVTAGEVGMNLRAGPSPNAALVGAAPNGTRVWVKQTGIPEAGAPSQSPMEWWFIQVPPSGVGFPRDAYVRAVGPTGERNLQRVS